MDAGEKRKARENGSNNSKEKKILSGLIGKELERRETMLHTQPRRRDAPKIVKKTSAECFCSLEQKCLKRTS